MDARPIRCDCAPCTARRVDRDNAIFCLMVVAGFVLGFGFDGLLALARLLS